MLGRLSLCLWKETYRVCFLRKLEVDLAVELVPHPVVVHLVVGYGNDLGREPVYVGHFQQLLRWGGGGEFISRVYISQERTARDAETSRLLFKSCAG